uniref:GH16 domain-containing protein n=1 Tax=Acrobeloides nanus TaxID=290746 RepID=A0A914E0T4_9BILA
MIGIQNGKVYMGADHTNSYPNSARLSVQIESTTRFNSGLFILSLDHMPTGPGVWPAFWTINRPYEGEIDVLEGISNLTYNSISLHQWKKDNDTDLCIMKNNDTQFFNGTWGTDWTHEPYLDCYGHARSNSTVMAGCGISAPQRTFNTDLVLIVWEVIF